MKTGCKVWLWIILVINVISTIISAFTIMNYSALEETYAQLGLALAPNMFMLTVISVLLSIVYIAGIAVLLFTKKKIGFYIMCVIALATAVINILSASGMGTIITSIIFAAIVPLITYFLIKDNVLADQA